MAAATAWQLARYKLPTALEQRLCTPSLVVYADVLRQNVERVIKACGGARRWQPHIKTVKSKQIIEELIDRGVKQFKCATSREAELLGQTLRGRGDGPFEVVVSYPHTGPTLARIAAAARACRYGNASDGDAEEDIVSWAVIVEDVAGAREVVEAVNLCVIKRHRRAAVLGNGVVHTGPNAESSPQQRRPRELRRRPARGPRRVPGHQSRYEPDGLPARSCAGDR